MSWELSSDEIAKATSAKATGSCMVHGVSSDTRENLKGKLFIALKGEVFNAHDFVTAAVGGGATAVMVHEDRPEYASLKSKAVFIHVEDTLEALQDLALYWRRKNKYKVVAISGSNGKTSSKDFAYQLIKDFQPTVASKGSLNNHWGVPLSILSADVNTKILILEMGMNHLGELEWLSQIAEPDIVAITMVGTSHIGELGSMENIAKAKEELYKMTPKSTAIFNLDNNWTSAMFERAEKAGTYARIITFSSHSPSAKIGMRAEKMTVDGLEINGHIGKVEGHCHVNVFGRHNINNLMVAASVATAVGMTPEEIWKKLPTIKASAWGRNQWIKLKTGTSILFDAYNANPASMAALLKNVYELELAGRKILILGEMLELGRESSPSHRELGEMVAKVGPDICWFIGEHYSDFQEGMLAGGFFGISFATPEFDEKISADIKGSLAPGDLVALKASRGRKLEVVLDHWGIKT